MKKRNTLYVLKYKFIKLMQKIIFILLITISLFTCCKNQNILNKEIIEKAILSNDFQEYYHIAKRRTKTFYVYNNIQNMEHVNFSTKNRFYQKINFLKVNFEFNINSSSERQHKGVVLYKYIIENGITKLGFVDLESNASLILKYDENFNLIGKRHGIF